MAKYTKIEPHLTEEELLSLQKEVKGFWRIQQIQVIVNAQRKRRTAAELAEFSHLSKDRITQLLREYNTLGKKLFEKKGQGGRKYGYISLEEEKEFLFPYKEKAKLGKVTTVSEIQDAFEKKVGKKVARSTIYRLLHRHDWRKLVPRPYHPKRDEKKQEEFKKNFQAK